jgi:hypothetical protein
MLAIAFLVVLMSAPIFAQTITVTNPDGTETWYKGTQYDITWTSESVTGNVKITLRDDSSEVLVIRNSTANDGTHPWTVPGTLTDGDYYVRVESRSDANIYGESPSFAIAIQPSITVTSPDGGESWEVDSSQQITWTTTGTVGNVKIEYSIDSGINWTPIVGSIASDSGSYDWTIPNTPSEDCLARISEIGDSLSDTSDDVFTIAIPPAITVVAPNGGENWEVGFTEQITWTSEGAVGKVKIEYSTDSGGSWKNIKASANNTGSYSWTIPDDPSTNCLVRISETDGDPSDTSDNLFTISPPPFITVTAPNGGENWEVGSSQQITWTSTGTADNVKIEYSIDNGANWAEVVGSIASDSGSYDWEVPDTPSAQCLVRISEIGGGLSDTSDATFSIVTVVGLLNVVINPQQAIDSGAQWKLTSETNWHGSGETVSYSPADDHILEFKAILGWSKPSDKSIMIKAGQTTYESGIYEKISFVTDKDSLAVPEGGTADFQVNLSGEPSSDVVVTVSLVAGGDEDITVKSSDEQLIFKTNNWNSYQKVRLEAAEDDDAENGQATILISAPGMEDKEISAIEDDNDELKFVVDKKRVTVPEGGEDTFKVKLSSKPSSDVLATIQKAGSGDSDIVVVSDSDPLQLTFSSDNWNNFQTVTLAAAEDNDVIDGEAIIQIRAPGFEEIDIIAVEQDNDISDIYLKLNPHTGTTGNIIKISIEISNNIQEINAFGLDFFYDDSLFTVKSIKKGSLTSDWSMIGGDEADSGKITLGGIAGGGQPIYEDSKGTLVRIWLKVKCDSLLEETPSEVKIENYKDGILAFSPERCTEIITLVPCSRVGDVNSDGDVTPGDAQNTLEIYLGKRAPEFCQKTTADSNGDESTTPGDAQDIFECYLGKKELPECHEDGSNGTSSAASFASFSKIRDKKRLRPSKPKLYALNTIGFPGKTVNIPIIITNPEGISSFSFEVNYLPELLEYTGIRRSQLSDEFDYLTGIEEIKGLVRVEGESKHPIEYSKYASLAVLAFRVKEGVNGNLPLIVFNPGRDLFDVEIDDGTFLGLEYFNEHERFLSLGNAIIMPDKTLRIPVKVSSAFNIKSFGLEIKYPKEKMLFAGINRGELTENFTTVEGNESEPGIVRVGGYSMSGIQEREPGMLVEIVLFIKEMDGKIEIVNLVDDIQDFIVRQRKIRVSEKRIREKKLWFRRLHDR